jgi:type II secretory pathway pseudopilin PulG
MALMVVLGGIAVPQVLGSIDRSRGRIAARFLGARMALARSQAVTRGAAVALRFEEGPEGISFSVFQDGNGNGVRTRDIQREIDRQIEAPIRLFEQFPGVQIAVGPDISGSDPVRIGSSNLLTFSPLGTATSGTVYVLGRDGTQWGVRVLGATGRTRVLRWVADTGEWDDTF